jgi:hypothetical protein
MKILPFFLQERHSHLKQTRLCVFLAHAGKALWSIEETLTESQLMEEYLKPNGIPSKRIVLIGSLALVEIDLEKINLPEFYTWEEALSHPQKPECWRSYYFFKDSSDADWFSPKLLQGSNEIEGKNIQDYYESILRHIVK